MVCNPSQKQQVAQSKNGTGNHSCASRLCLRVMKGEGVRGEDRYWFLRLNLGKSDAWSEIYIKPQSCVAGWRAI